MSHKVNLSRKKIFLFIFTSTQLKKKKNSCIRNLYYRLIKNKHVFFKIFIYARFPITLYKIHSNFLHKQLYNLLFFQNYCHFQRNHHSRIAYKCSNRNHNRSDAAKRGMDQLNEAESKLKITKLRNLNTLLPDYTNFLTMNS